MAQGFIGRAGHGPGGVRDGLSNRRWPLGRALVYGRRAGKV